MKIFVIFFAGIFCVAMMSEIAWGQTTYTWNQPVSGDWTTATNWTPSRTTPTTSDVLVIDGGLTPSPTVTDVPTETIGRLVILSGGVPTMSGPLTILTIDGGLGDDLDIAFGCSLTVNIGLGLAISSGATANLTGTLILKGGSRFINAGAVLGPGTCRTVGEPGIDPVILDNRGTFSVPLEVDGDTTAVGDFIDNVTTFAGTILVVTGATLSLSAGGTLIADSDVTVNGTLIGGMGSTFTFNGVTFTNDGSVTFLTMQFNRAGAQTLAGTGTWVAGIVIQNGSTTSLASAVTVSAITVDSGATLSLGGNTLTLTAGSSFINAGTVSGAGTCRTVGAPGTPVYLDNQGTFSALLEIDGDTTAVGDSIDAVTTFAETILVVFGATLSLSGGNTLIAEGDVTVNGTLIGGIGSTFTFNGVTFTNDGSVTSLSMQFNRAGAQTLAGTGTWVAGIVIQNGSTTSLANAVTFDGSLTLTSGNLITTSSNLLTLGASASVSEGSSSSFISGPMAHTVASGSRAMTFPIGKDGAYRPITLTVTQDDATFTVYTAEVFNSAPPSRTLPGGINNVSIVRYWNVAKGSGANLTDASITLDYDSDDGVSSPTDLRIVKDDGIGNWIDLGGTGTGAPTGNITSTVNFTVLSDFTLANVTGGDNPLPVELSSFTATASDGSVTLRWRTESETENLGFNIYRSESRDGHLIKVNSGMLPGAGNSDRPHDYKFTDEEVQAGHRYFYSIEDVDLRGMTHRSKRIEVFVPPDLIVVKDLPKAKEVPKAFALFQNFPNPFNPETWIPYQLPQATSVEVTIYDSQGRWVRTLPLGNQEADYYKTRETAAYWDGRDHLGQPTASGVYFYHIRAGDFTQTRKMMIVK